MIKLIEIGDLSNKDMQDMNFLVGIRNNLGKKIPIGRDIRKAAKASMKDIINDPQGEFDNWEGSLDARENYVRVGFLLNHLVITSDMVFKMERRFARYYPNLKTKVYTADGNPHLLSFKVYAKNFGKEY